MAAPLTIPGGKEKGLALQEATVGSLTYWADRIETTISSGGSRDAARDRLLAAGMRSELAARKGGSVARPASTTTAARPRPAASTNAVQPNTGLATRAQSEALSGSFSEPSKVMQVLRRAAEEAHLVTPQTSCGSLPVGCVIATSIVWVTEADTYGIPKPESDRRGLDKTALEKIAAAAGLSWDPQLTVRLDNGRDPHYVHYRAVGYVRSFDGSLRTEVGSVEIDLRDGSDAAETMDKELPGARKFILRSAETKSMNRVIRRLGVKTNYTRAELQKPFVVASIMFTGQTDDPALKLFFAGKTADAFLGAKTALYAPARAALPPGHEPPPLNAAYEVDDSDPSSDEPYDDGEYEGDYGDDADQAAAAAAAAAKQPPVQEELKT